MRGPRILAGVCAAAAVALCAPSAASPQSVAATTTEHRPGPDILYAPPADAPQLENRPGSGWHADPLLVSGAAAYESGEYLYQGYLFDDHGGAGVPDAGNDPMLQSFLFAAKYGSLTYPTDPVYANNAADLLEFRVRPTRDATAIRVTLNTLQDPAKTAFTVAIGTSPSSVAWPDSAGVSSPASLFLTVHGTTATLTRAATGAAIQPAPTVVADTFRRQYDLRIPHSAWDPGSSTVRFAAGVGLWDTAAQHYLVPGATASATQPGGESPSGEALFDLAFRFEEPEPDWNVMGLSATLADGAVMEQADQHCFWRDCAQAAALRTGDVSTFHAYVDFGKLQHGVTDLSQVPRTGSIDRIHASHFDFGQGVATSNCGRFPVTCHGMFPGNLQPYNIYVPNKPTPAAGFGLTLQLHASGGNYNEYMGSNNQVQLGDRGPGSIVLTALARDPDGDYTDATEADVFEAWADAARHYRLDPTRTVVTGYSMGGGGTYKMLERWPDLFARGFAAAAVPYDSGFQGQWIRNMRNDPLLVWISLGDEGSPVLYQDEQIPALEAQGQQFTFDQFAEGDHVTLATNDQYDVAAAWLGDAQVMRDPTHITYAVDPQNDFPDVGDVADHAYWLSGMTLRSDNAPTPPSTESITGGLDPGAAQQSPFALVDAHSQGFGLSDPAVVAPGAPSAGVLLGGHHGPMPYLETTQTWAAPEPAAQSDRLVLSATNLATVTVDVAGAHLTCGLTLDVQTDGPLTVNLPACGRSIRFDAGHAVQTLS